MINTILESFDIWTRAQTIKSNGRTAGVDNQRLLGIDKLRELILELAVRGKLVPQDEKDEPALSLIKRIFKQKKRLEIEEGLKTSAKENIDPKEKYLQQPLNWEYCRLGNLGKFIDYRGGTPAKTPSGIPLITAKNVRFGYISNEPKEYISEDEYKNWMTRGFPRKRDILFTTEAPLGNVAIIKTDEIFALAQRVICIQLHEPDITFFLKILLMSSSFRKELSDKATGMTATGIKAANLKELPIILPPLAEQHRIVAKVDELMALCDQLEQQQTENNTTHHQLVELLLQNLTEASGPEAFANAWQRIATNFDTLFTTEYSIDQLKQTILQLAVMGKLVPQDAKDEPASELLKRIAKEKERLVKEGKIKKQEKWQEITEEEKPFELPRGWEWVRFGNIWMDSFYGPRFGIDEYVGNDGYPTIRTTDMTSDCRIELKSPPCVTVPENKIKLYRVEKGDLLITRSGSIGTMAIFDLDVDAIPSAYLIRVRLSKSIYPRYILSFLQSPTGMEYLGLNTTSVGVPNINASNMSLFQIPIPPLTEQHRIVAKVDELFALCDGLKGRIKEGQEMEGKLAEGVVDGVLE